MNEVLAAGQDSTRPLVYCELVRQALNCTRTYFFTAAATAAAGGKEQQEGAGEANSRQQATVCQPG